MVFQAVLKLLVQAVFYEENSMNISPSVTWASHHPDIKIYQEENTVILLLFQYSNKIGRSAHYAGYYLDFEKYGSVRPVKL